jgi:hypothetical protein
MRNAPHLTRRQFLSVAPSAALSLASLFHGEGNISAAQRETKLPLIVLFLSGGASTKEMFNPDPQSVSSDLRGPIGSIPTSTSGVHFSELFPLLAARQEKFALLRALDTGSSDHTPSMQTAMLKNGKTVTEIAGERAADGGVPYVLLNPGSTWYGLRDAFRIEQSFAPLWDPSTRSFRPPTMQQGMDLSERRALLEALDTTPIHSPAAERMQRFRQTAFDLLQGGGRFFEALDLPEPDRLRYGQNLTGDMVLTAKRFIERGAGAVTLYHEPESIAWDAHSDIEGKYRRLAPEVDQAAAAIIDEIAANRLECVFLLTTEFNRTPRMNPTGRDHWQHGNWAIMAGGHTKAGAVHGRTDHRGNIRDGGVMQRDTLPNTVLVACGAEINPAEQRVREILQ